MTRDLLRLVCFFVPMLLAGCATGVRVETARNDVAAQVRERLGDEMALADEASSDRDPTAELGFLLSPLSAVQLALYHNPRVHSALQELGIARADVVEVVTLDNPTLGTAVLWPFGESGYTLDLELGQNVSNLLLMSSRREFAGLRFEEAQLRAANEVLEVAADAEAAYFAAVGARHVTAVNRLIAEATAASYAYATRQREAGNLSELETIRERAMFEDARVALADSQLEEDRRTYELHRVMSLSPSLAERFDIPNHLPEVPHEELELSDLERFGVENSLRLAILRTQVDAMALGLGISRDWRWLGAVEFGALTEREVDGTWLAGPSLSVEIPIFNRHQARLARQEAQLRQSESRLIETAIEVRTDIRTHRQALWFARQKANHHLTVIIPNRENVVALTQRHYNYMLLGVYEVLEAKRAEYAAYREYIDALRDYWISRAELRRAVGGRLPAMPLRQEADETPEVVTDPHAIHRHERNW